MITKYGEKRDRYQVGQLVDSGGSVSIASLRNAQGAIYPFGLFVCKDQQAATIRDGKLPAAAADRLKLYGVAQRTLNELQAYDPAVAAATVDGYKIKTEAMNVITRGTVAVPLLIRETTAVSEVLKVAYGDTGFGIALAGYLVQEDTVEVTPNCTTAVKGIVIEDIDYNQVLEDHGADGKIVVAHISLDLSCNRA